MPDWANPVWHLYVVQHNNRDSLQKALDKAGVGTLIHYPIPPHLQKAYANMKHIGQFKIAERMADQVLSLPIYPQMSDVVVETVISAIHNSRSEWNKI